MRIFPDLPKNLALETFVKSSYSDWYDIIGQTSVLGP